MKGLGGVKERRGIDPLHYSTVAIPQPGGDRGWSSVPAVFEVTASEDFAATGDVAVLGGVVVTYAGGSARTLKRSLSRIAGDNVNALAVGILLEGVITGIAGEREFSVSPGEILLIDMQQASTMTLKNSRIIELGVRRNLAIEAGFNVAGLHGFVVNSSAARMLLSHLGSIRDAMSQLSEEEGPRVARTLLDMLVVAVNVTARARHAGEVMSATPLNRARQEIRANLGSHTLSIAALCKRLEVSRSTLHRMFEHEGGVQAFIRNSRLDAVRIALLDSESKERIGNIAERLGFSDAAHLSRLFRLRFGETPSQFRARARGKKGA